MYVDTRARSREPGGPDGSAVDRRSWFERAHELARTGRFRDADEVCAALLAHDDSAVPSRNGIIRGAIDIACLRARGEEGWHARLDLQTAIPAGE